MKTENHIQMQHYINVRRAYFDEMFLPAMNSVQGKIIPIEKNFTIAGKNIRLKFYTPSLVDFMTRALAHHPSNAAAAPDLTIHLLDAVSTGAAVSAPWNNPEHFFKHETDTNQETENYFSGVYWYDETLNLYDRKTSEAYFWTHDATTLANWVAAAPLRGIIHWLMSDHHMHLIHGAIVGINGKSVLLSAKSGSGKSTTALACLLSGMEYIADDYSIVEPRENNSPIAHNLYNSVKVLPDGFLKFAELKNHTIWNRNTYENGTDPKALIFMQNDFRDQMKLFTTLSAIFIPKITGRETKIVPTAKMEAMLALIPSTLFQLPLPGANKVEELKKIIASTPCYTLELGPDMRGISDIIKQFLDKNQV